MDLKQLEQAIELLKLINTTSDNNTTPQKTQNEELNKKCAFIGKKVLIRAHLKGVQVGVVQGIDDCGFMTLSPARKLWRWQSKKSIALESVAKFGITEGTRATAINDNDGLRCDDICGIIELSDEIYQEIMGWPVSEQD
jgi:hypothetical protein